MLQFPFPKLDDTLFRPMEIPDNLRLGHQMEYVFQYLIANSSLYDVIYHNVLIEEGKRRIGELDFILKNTSTGKYHHVELAYKFYIINPNISEPIYRLMGPNKRDMFFTKMDKLKIKQLPLLHHDNLKTCWQPLGISPKEIQQECCFKAQLFQPFGEKITIRPINMDCIAGSWVRYDDFNSQTFKPFQFYIPKKIEWVIAPHDSVPWSNHHITLMEVNLRMIRKSAPMLWMKKASGEMEKLFVVWW